MNTVTSGSIAIKNALVSGVLRFTVSCAVGFVAFFYFIHVFRFKMRAVFVGDTAKFWTASLVEKQRNNSWGSGYLTFGSLTTN